MNAIELYRSLPRKNCGRCSQKACMPFALSVIKGDAQLDQCPYLSEEETAKLRESITKKDWREELILSLREKIKNIDLSAIPADLGGDYRDNRLIMPCLGREYAISKDGEILAKGHITPWIRILLLHYINTHGRAELSGRWASFGELKSGMVKASSFQRECEEPLREMLDNNIEMTTEVLQMLGARENSSFPTPHAWIIFLLPKVPAAVLYWPAEDEFSSKAKILFDQTADRFLDVESLIFLLEGLVKNIQMGLHPDSSN